MWIKYFLFVINGFNAVHCSVNLAFKKPANLSSNYYSGGKILYTAERAVDENTGGVWETGTCTHTSATRGGKVWWQVDMGVDAIITRVVIQYRRAYPDRMNGYVIKLYDNALGINGSVCFQDTKIGDPPTNDSHLCTVQGRYARYENNIGFAEICNFEAYGCPLNYYGNGTCNEICPVNCLTSPCNPDNGSCIGGCQVGWRGARCEQACKDGTYGQNCSLQCFCRISACNKVTGLCPSGGCQRGWSGPNCNESCTTGRFGFDCLSTCKCVDTNCHPENGTCESGVCLPGWTLHSCSEKCPSNTFGQNCSGVCGNCADGMTCNHVTGVCDIGCSDGWLGMYCNISCDPGFYGFNCSKECGNCYNGTSCAHVNGNCPGGRCDPGWRGENCIKRGAIGQNNQSGTSPIATVIVTILVLAAVGGLIIFIIIRRKKNKERESLRYSKPFVELKEETLSRKPSISKSNEMISANSSNAQISEEPEKGSHENLAFTEDEAIYSNNLEEDICTNSLIFVKDLSTVIEDKREEIFQDEYSQLPVGLQFPYEVGKNPNNKIKNRFLATFPYDKNRVILPSIKGVEYSDYINASYIDGLDTENAYIATQGPKKATVQDFWRMVWKENVSNIVMLTNLVEGAKTKCEKYWPDINDELLSGPLVITNKKETKYAAFVKREFKITSKKTEKTKQICQYHFTEWPDHGTPDATQLVHFNTRIELRTGENSSPLLVHCSAGIGRTGTFIGLHELSKHARKSGSLDVFQYAKLMRRGRMNMIQTLEQYVFLHEALLESLMDINTTYLREEFPSIRESLFSEDVPRNQTKLWTQFELLKSMKPVYDDSCYSDGMSEQNISKNRNMDIVAHNKFRTYLMTYPSSSTDYINAVRIPSYKQLRGYITTQIPLPATVEDFWSMVYDHDCNTIVTLDCIPENVILTPPLNEYMQLKSFVVYREREFHRSQKITDIDIILSSQGSTKEKDRKIKMFVTTAEQSTDGDTELFISLCECLTELEKTTEDGTVVLACSDGALNCGVFATMATTVQRILTDKDLDIFQAVKIIQQRRPQFVNTFEQYKLIHDLIIDYMDCNQLYVNV